MSVLKNLDSVELERYKKEVICLFFESNKIASQMDDCNLDSAKEKVNQLSLYLTNNKALVFGCFEEEKLIGVIGGYSHLFRDDKKRLYVSIIYVDEKYRNHHISNKLLTAIEKEAKKQGYSSVFLHVEENDKRLRLCEQMGYVKERIQLVKKINNANAANIGGIRFTQKSIIKYKEALAELLYINTKAHFDCQSYTMKDANTQIDGLIQYIIDDKAIALGYIEDEELQGFIWTFPYSYKSEMRYMLNAISVFPKNRGQGIAKKLLCQAEAEIVKKGIKKIYTWVDCINNSAYCLYISTGMNIEAYQLCKKL